MSILLLTPPFTQLNTPYPATCYLKGFLDSIAIPCQQRDLGIDVLLEIFSVKGLSEVFSLAKKADYPSDNAKRMMALEESYLQTIGLVVKFLQNSDDTLAQHICNNDFLPEAGRFMDLPDFNTYFGLLGLRDKARHLATLYLTDLSDLICELVDPHFGFSRYAEKLGLSSASFDPLMNELETKGWLECIIEKKLDQYLETCKPKLVCLSVPFPGNLYAAFVCGKYIKANHPKIKIALGGGYANTELRDLSDLRVFNFIDYVTLDDGELPIQQLYKYLDTNGDSSCLKRTFLKYNDRVLYCDNASLKDIPQFKTGTPTYIGLDVNKYLSVIEILNPMHKLWSDGRWNKLTLAHGCYWGKCTFCDISLDYIGRYEPLKAALIVDKVEKLIIETGQTGFHFVDEAAPPSLMRDVAIEILKRKIKITWWTNIRFEKTFSQGLSQLLAASGCIAVSGGLEVASDRLLELIKKGVTVKQVAQVCQNLTNAGILVHAYLMYGFPTQNDQEIIDSMEMVRQLFEQQIIQSGYWHRFSATKHSPVGINPEAFNIRITTPKGLFANNDLEYEDLSQNEPDKFSEGLKASLFNYMHLNLLEIPVGDWFEFKTPKPTVHKKYIRKALNSNKISLNDHSRILWIGPRLEEVEIKSSKDNKYKKLIVHHKKYTDFISEETPVSEWILESLNKGLLSDYKMINLSDLELDFNKKNHKLFEDFLNSETFYQLSELGLLIL